jgi:hypothetical protein
VPVGFRSRAYHSGMDADVNTEPIPAAAKHPAIMMAKAAV